MTVHPAPEDAAAVVWLALDGEIDLASAARWRADVDAALQARPSAVVMDLSGVTFMDSSGLALVAVLVRGEGGHRPDVYVVEAQPMVRQALEVCGLTRLVTVADLDQLPAPLRVAGEERRTAGLTPPERG